MGPLLTVPPASKEAFCNPLAVGHGARPPGRTAPADA